MRGPSTLLKNLEENKKDIRNLLIRMLVANVGIVFVFWRNSRSTWSFLRWTIPELLFFPPLMYMICPVIKEEEKDGVKTGVKSVVSCRSMKAPGLTSAFADGIAFGIAAKVASNISPILAMLLLFFIPFCFAIEIVYKPYKQMIQGSGKSNKKIINKNK